jgi:hypothetical protein
MRDDQMQLLSIRVRRALRAASLVAALAAPATLAACSDFLTAKNPGAVEEPRLSDTTMIDLMVNGVIGEFQGGSGSGYAWLAYYSAIYTDELRNHHVFFEEGLFDQRRVNPDNGTYSFFLYTPLQRARWLADSVAGRIQALKGDAAATDIRLARAYGYAGHSLILLGELLCETPVPVGERYGVPLPSDQVLALAVQRFDSAIKISRAARAAAAALPPTSVTAAAITRADSIVNWALVGAARASLQRNDKAKALEYARQVAGMGTTADFEFRVYFNESTANGIYNIDRERLSGGAGVTTGSVSGTNFISLDDARVPHPLTTAGAPQAEVATGGSWVVPNSPPSFSSFNNTKAGADFVYGGWIRIASLLEAKYIIAEAEGPTAANIAFLESRRTAFPSSTTPTPVDATNFFASLREQRRRDFYLDGHRMGDLRRYEKQQGVDLWPSGSFFGSTTIQYNTQKCWPLTLAEATNNPMVPKPYTPPNGP